MKEPFFETLKEVRNNDGFTYHFHKNKQTLIVDNLTTFLWICGKLGKK